jgi:hypothetical protein
MFKQSYRDMHRERTRRGVAAARVRRAAGQVAGVPGPSARARTLRSVPSRRRPCAPHVRARARARRRSTRHARAGPSDSDPDSASSPSVLARIDSCRPARRLLVWSTPNAGPVPAVDLAPIDADELPYAYARGPKAGGS